MNYRVLGACVLSGCLLVAAANAKELHVSPSGTASGDGSSSKPWDLATALSHPSIAPGDVVWLHGGDYSGSFVSELTGTQTNPIVVRSAPGEWARIDGKTGASSTFELNGAWTIYRDFEITNTEPDRWGDRPGGIDVFGSNLKLVNLVIHDLGNNGFWSSAQNSEIYGCLVYHNGFDDSDRGHGHGIYTQNSTGTKTIADNIVFGGYSFGIHVYTESGAIEGYDLIGNVWFNAGVISSVSGHKDDCLIGGLKPADRISLRENLAWAIGGDTRCVRLGYSVPNGEVTLQNNYFIGALNFASPWSSIGMTGNTLCTVTGVDTQTFPNNTYLTSTPTVPKIFVRPNKYELGRAHVVVYNWGEAPSQPVDLSSVLSVGDAFEIRNAQDYFGPPVVTGTFQGGTVSIPQIGLKPVQPVGTPGSYDPADQTGSLFNAFVVRKIASACSSAASCNDNNPCTTDDCQQGVCVNTPAAGCCQSAAECDDGDPCTADSCSGHACQHSTVTGCCKDASQCDDGTACTEDSCDANVCQHKALAACCAKDSDCADTNGCTIDTCESSTGTCVNEPAANGCSADTDCADDNPCTHDKCLVGSCSCAHDEIESCKPDSGDGGVEPPSDASVSSDATAQPEGGVSDAAEPQANAEESSDSGCGCSTPSRRSPSPLLATLVAVVLAGLRRRRPA